MRLVRGGMEERKGRWECTSKCLNARWTRMEIISTGCHRGSLKHGLDMQKSHFRKKNSTLYSDVNFISICDIETQIFDRCARIAKHLRHSSHDKIFVYMRRAR